MYISRAEALSFRINTFSYWTSIVGSLYILQTKKYILKNNAWHQQNDTPPKNVYCISFLSSFSQVVFIKPYPKIMFPKTGRKIQFRVRMKGVNKPYVISGPHKMSPGKFRFQWGDTFNYLSIVISWLLLKAIASNSNNWAQFSLDNKVKLN